MLDTTKFSRCLIVAPSWVGDMVMAQSLFKALKKQNAKLQIDVLAPAWCAALTNYMPEVNQLIEAPFTHGVFGFAERRKLAKQLRGQYDVAYVLPNSLKSALVPWMANIPVRVGFIGEQRYGLLNQRHTLNKKSHPLMVQRFLALASPQGSRALEREELPLPRLQVERNDLVLALDKYSLRTNILQSGPLSQEGHKNSDQGILILCPGAEFGAAKQWPTNHYSAVARYYLDQGWQVWLFGSKKDQTTCSEINTLALNACINLAGKTSLSEAIALMSAANLVVSNDSGLMHVAAALHKPLVAVYGSTDPGFTPPLNENAKVERLDLDCSPCFKRECPLGHLDCLVTLSSSQVLSATESLLAMR